MASVQGGGELTAVTVPQTHYARNGEAHVACQVVGEGPSNLLVSIPVQSWALDYQTFQVDP